jgi:AcrR family transcriptional regulator
MAPPAELRRPLSRDQVLRAALELADVDGIESLTMRKLGQSLGFGVMSLYNHVASKDDVLDGILDLVLAESEPPSPAGDWDTAIEASAISVHDALRRHPWAATVLMAPAGHARPARWRYMELLLARLRDAGFSAQTTYHAYHVLDGHIFGFSVWETSHSYTDDQAAELGAEFERITADGYPHVREHAEQHANAGPHQQVRAFDFGLDLILEGLRKVPRRTTTD